MRNRVTITVVIAALFAIVSCDSSPSGKIVGKWQEANGGDKI